MATSTCSARCSFAHNFAFSDEPARVRAAGDDNESTICPSRTVTGPDVAANVSQQVLQSSSSSSEASAATLTPTAPPAPPAALMQEDDEMPDTEPED